MHKTNKLLNSLTKIANIIPFLGLICVETFSFVGNLFIFFLSVIKAIFLPPFYFRQIFKHLWNIGYLSLPVVGFTAIFTGAALALQSYNGFSRMHAENAVAMVVVLSLTRELAPVLTGLMLAGRVGATIAAEIATMRVTDQIDALYTFHVHPLRYLVVPRVIVGTIISPLLVLIADIIGILGGHIVAIYRLGFESNKYLEKTINIIEISDIMAGIYKAAVFGFIVCFIGAYFGYNSKNGASGVGKATTNSVVLSSIMILLSNYIITSLLS